MSRSASLSPNGNLNAQVEPAQKKRQLFLSTRRAHQILSGQAAAPLGPPLCLRVFVSMRVGIFYWCESGARVRSLSQESKSGPMGADIIFRRCAALLPLFSCNAQVGCACVFVIGNLFRSSMRRVRVHNLLVMHCFFSHLLLLWITVTGLNGTIILIWEVKLCAVWALSTPYKLYH
jgi:hypothetical protein